MDVTVKNILGSISKLRGASVEEIASDLGAPVEGILPTLDQLAKSGYVRAVGNGVPVAPIGERRFSAEKLTSGSFEVTPRGFLELRS